jgi:hypothetical protein
MNTRIHNVSTQVLNGSLFLGMLLASGARATTLPTSMLPVGDMFALHGAPSLQTSVLEQPELVFGRALSVLGAPLFIHVQRGVAVTFDDANVDDLGSLDLALGQAVPLHKVISSTGTIEADVNAFRALLGNPNNNGAPGHQLTGHREVNWDGVPAQFTNVPTFPPNFFNSNSPRGLEYSVTGGGLQVSNQSFVDIDPAYADEFHPFSGGKTFSPRGRNDSVVEFDVAGTLTPAAVRGFGVVFVDVDEAGSSGIELFDARGASLGRFMAPVRTDRRGASFVGVVFRSPIIASARIVTGDAALAPGVLDVNRGGTHDLAVMDDLIYGEPTATGQ